MTRPRVVVTHWVHPEILELLSPECDVFANRTRGPLLPQEVLARCREARAILAFMPDRIDGAFLDRCPDLGIVAAALKGTDNIDLEACTARGVWVTGVPDLLTAPTAELAVALLVSLSRRIPEGDRIVRSGSFRGWRPVLYAPGLAGRTVGILGMGAVGQAVAARLAAWSCRILYHDARPLPEERARELGAAPAPLEALAEASDAVVVSLPLTPRTHRTVDDRFLGRLRPGAIVVNVGRGSVVDEAAVARALESGRLGGYGADVFECEDLSREDRPSQIAPELLRPGLPTLFTPHLGSAVESVRLEIARAAARSILDFVRGGVPSGAVNHPASGRLPGRSPEGRRGASASTSAIEARTSKME